MKAAIYCRVSTNSQEYKNQLLVLEQWAGNLRLDHAGNTLEVVATYAENESAWQSGHQKELSRLLADAARSKFKYVLIWALDRLTREGIQAQFELMSKFSRFGVQVFSYQETWTLTPSKVEFDLLLAIAAYIAQSESERRSARTKAGIDRKRATGWKPGRPLGSKNKKKARVKA